MRVVCAVANCSRSGWRISTATERCCGFAVGKVPETACSLYRKKSWFSGVNTTRPIDRNVGSSKEPDLEHDTANVVCKKSFRPPVRGQIFKVGEPSTGFGTAMRPTCSNRELICGSSRSYWDTKAVKQRNSTHMSAPASFSKSDRHLMICDSSVETNGGIQTRKKTAPISSEPPDSGGNIASIREFAVIN